MSYTIIPGTDNDPLVAYPDGRIYAPFGDFVNCTISVCPVELSVYGYRPTLAGSSALIALYGICALIQVAMGIRYKTWGFMTAMVLGCFTEILGYVGRIMMYQNPWDDAGFIMQIVLITIGPVFFSAAIYVMIYKIIMYINPAKSRLQPRAIYWAFISADIVSLILQAVGGAMSSTSNGASSAGVNIALAGLGFQVATLFFFVVVVADYAWRSRSTWTAYTLPRPFKVFCAFLGLGTLLIWIRCCYRVYELSEGYTSESEALRDEPLFIGLEMIMVLLASWALIIAHPGPVFERGAKGPAEQERNSTEEKLGRPAGNSSSEEQTIVV